MSERRLSPTAATNRVRRAVRARMKILREDSRPVREVRGIDSPHVFAGRLVALLEDAAQDNPGPWSDEWADHVLNHAWQQYLRLCEVAPIREQVKA